MRLRYYFQFRELIYEKMSFRAHIIPLKANISLFATPAGMRRRTAAPHLPAARPDVALRRRMLSRMRCFAAAPERVIRRLRKYKGTGASERAEFYCEINIFFCEWTDRLLRDNFFYLRAEFFLAGDDLSCAPCDPPAGGGWLVDHLPKAQQKRDRDNHHPLRSPCVMSRPLALRGPPRRKTSCLRTMPRAGCHYICFTLRRCL